MTDFERIFQNWTLPIMVLDRDFNIVFSNPIHKTTTGTTDVDIYGRHIFDVFPESDERVDLVQQRLEQTLNENVSTSYQVEFKVPDETGNPQERIWEVTHEPYPGIGDAVTHIVMHVADVTDAIKAERERELIRGELDHRMKNIHTVVGAMARLSSRSADSLEGFRDDFLGRLESMSRAHERLIRTGTRSIALDDIVADEIFSVAPDYRDGVTMNGDTVVLNAGRSRSLSMMVHELATNAVKYGAFSRPSGRLSVDWQVKDGQLHFTWMESGLTDITEPTRQGFGTKMIRMLSPVTYKTIYAPTGLSALIVLDIGE